MELIAFELSFRKSLVSAVCLFEILRVIDLVYLAGCFLPSKWIVLITRNPNAIRNGNCIHKIMNKILVVRVIFSVFSWHHKKYTHSSYIIVCIKYTHIFSCVLPSRSVRFSLLTQTLLCIFQCIFILFHFVCVSLCSSVETKKCVLLVWFFPLYSKMLVWTRFSRVRVCIGRQIHVRYSQFTHIFFSASFVWMCAYIWLQLAQ